MNFVKELCRYNDLNRGVKNEITPTDKNNTSVYKKGASESCKPCIALKNH